MAAESFSNGLAQIKLRAPRYAVVDVSPQIVCAGSISSTFMKRAATTCRKLLVASTCIGVPYSGYLPDMHCMKLFTTGTVNSVIAKNAVPRASRDDGIGLLQIYGPSRWPASETWRIAKCDVRPWRRPSGSRHQVTARNALVTRCRQGNVIRNNRQRQIRTLPHPLLV